MILYLREAKSYGQFHIRLTECFTPFCNQTVVCWKVVQQNLFWPNVDFQLYLSTENIRIIKRKTWKKNIWWWWEKHPGSCFPIWDNCCVIMVQMSREFEMSQKLQTKYKLDFVRWTFVRSWLYSYAWLKWRSQTSIKTKLKNEVAHQLSDS